MLLSALFLLSIQSRPLTYGFVLSIVTVGPKAPLLLDPGKLTSLNLMTVSHHKILNFISKVFPWLESDWCSNNREMGIGMEGTHSEVSFLDVAIQPMTPVQL